MNTLCFVEQVRRNFDKADPSTLWIWLFGYIIWT